VSSASRLSSAAGDATETIREGQPITVSCAEGDTGFIYDGALPFEQKNLELDSLPPITTKIMMNVGNPDRAFDFASIPHRGVGLARLEFIINRMIGVHPRALLEFDQLPADLQQTIRRQMSGYAIRCRSISKSCAKASGTIAAGVRAGAGDRALVGLQVERVREPDRRAPVRAARRESDARFPRRFALRRRGVPSLLRARVSRAQARARADGTQERADHGAVRAHREGSRAGDAAAGSQRA
jgi:pyruvate,water dikinase